MPRAPRADEAGAIYHALNRGNARQPIFFKDGDYDAFERVVAKGLKGEKGTQPILFGT